MAKPFIVIAEDEKAYGNVYLNKLASEGMDVVWVEDGTKIIPTLLKRKPDLLVLDLIMPGMDGFNALKQLRAIPELQDLRVVVASNLSQDIDKAKVAEYNIYGYFVKSDLSIGEVTERIKDALPKR
jgi:DNA-binding response OmpR family regulator